MLSGKRVLFAPDYDYTGGTRSFAERILTIHAHLGIHTGLLLEPSQDVIPLPDAVARHITVIRGPARSRVFWRAYLSLLHDVRGAVPAIRRFRPHALHISTGTPGLMLGALANRLPAIVTIHTYPVKRLRPGLPAIAAALTASPRRRVVTPSCFAADRVRDFMGIAAERVRVIPNSVRSDISAGQSERMPIVLTIGDVAHYKAPDTWVAIARKVVALRPTSQFIWLGEGPLRSAMQAVVREQNLESNVIFPGYAKDVDAYYRRARLYLHPSRMDSQSIAVSEAMAHALPCVTSDAGGLPETIAHDVSGYVCAVDDVESFVARCLQLLDDPDAATAMGQLGREDALQRFSPDVQRARFEGVYREILCAE